MNKDTLIQGLNQDLAAELGTVIRYTYQAARCYGLLASELRELLVKEAHDELDHAAFLMDVIQDLGGEPTTTPKPFEKPTDLKGMLELDVKMEGEDVVNYLAHSKLAEQLELPELKMKLEEMAADEAGHGRELRRLLKGL
ncbi:MAG TPA: ferritin-like domain-containing protein [Verrucomicrobia bacterium]|nr:ferritin-like domain-containing protein [Verrucomicrobiota bacterium]HOP98711.1 ferritin-like domain-containing protein [Verrucomicrobiota bacterium]